MALQTMHRRCLCRVIPETAMHSLPARTLSGPRMLRTSVARWLSKPRPEPMKAVIGSSPRKPRRRRSREARLLPQHGRTRITPAALPRQKRGPHPARLPVGHLLHNLLKHLGRIVLTTLTTRICCYEAQETTEPAARHRSLVPSLTGESAVVWMILGWLLM